MRNLRHLPRLSVDIGFAIALAVVVTGCSHATTSSGGTGGAGATGGSNTGSGGSNLPGTGGNTGTGNTAGGTGGSIDPGTGGGINPGTGGGTAGVSGGTGGVGGAPVRTACQASTFNDTFTPGYTRDPAVTTQVTNLLAQMTPADKAGQMRGTDPATAGFNDIFRTPDNAARGVRGFLFRDGPRGVNLDAPVTTGTQRGRSTVFPVSMARGATWDLNLEYRIGQALGDEMIAAGQTMLLVPTANILRHPLWGRAQETYGEDPYQLGRLGTALVVGLQQYVPGCAKHYAGNNIEAGRAGLNAMMDEQTLREIYARHFGMMVKDGGVACIMAAYNAINGLKSTQNAHLLNDILRTDFGFKGFVLSDWWAMPGGSTAALADASRRTNAAQAVQAGMDMETPWALNYSVLEVITGAGLTQTVVDQAAGRILEQKLRFKINQIGGTFGLKAKDPATTLTNGSVTNPAHVNLALEAALKGIVLLKNNNNTLPIKRGGTVRTIAVVGARQTYTVSNPGDDHNGGVVDFPNTVRTGDNGSSRVNNDPALSIGPTAGIQMAAGAGITVTAGNAIAAAQAADFVVVIAGLTPQDEGEEYTGASDRASFSLDAKSNTKVQDALIMQVAALGKPMVVVLEGGSVIDMPWLAMVPAVAMAWYPGMVGGKAMGQLLFGDVNFSGKLPITWGASVAQYPAFNPGTTTTMDYDLGYRRFDRMNTTPLFPFGFGMSYTTFRYANLQLSCSPVMVGAPATTTGVAFSALPNSFVNVTVDITNTGTVAGEEIAFLFASYPAGATPRRPVKELKGFARVQLDPGATKTVTIPVRISDLAYFDMTTMNWKVQTGAMKLMVGGSSATASLTLSDTLMVQ